MYPIIMLMKCSICGAIEDREAAGVGDISSRHRRCRSCRSMTKWHAIGYHEGDLRCLNCNKKLSVWNRSELCYACEETRVTNAIAEMRGE